MINYLFVALAVFWLIRLIQTWVDAPSWLWAIVPAVLCCAILYPWRPDWMSWYAPFAIAGIVAFLQMLENLIIAKSDEAISSIMRRR